MVNEEIDLVEPEFIPKGGLIYLRLQLITTHDKVCTMFFGNLPHCALHLVYPG